MLVRSLFFVGVLAACLAGCKSPCHNLADKRCDCAGGPTEKANCLQLNSQNEAAYPRTPEQEEICKGLYEACDCRQLNTPEGKRNCGVAN